MGLFHIFSRVTMDDGIKQWKSTEHAVLLDVRTAQEYTQAHVPGSVNIPLQAIQNTQTKIRDKQTPLFVHCLSGSRSSQAVSMLKNLGYTNVTNIGGISSYHGQVVPGT